MANLIEGKTAPEEVNTAIGELFFESTTLVATEYEGTHITVAAEGAASSHRSFLKDDYLAVIQGIIKDNSAKVVRVNEVGTETNYLVSTDATGFSILIELASDGSVSSYSGGYCTWYP